MNNSRIFSAGLAMFAMLFGAGNVIFPLALGRDVGSSVWPALAGFCLMSVFVPLLGIVSTVLYGGDYRKFLGTVGRVPGMIIALLCMVLIGPFGCIPRCVAVSYGAIQWYVPNVSLLLFSMLAGVIIFALTVRKNNIVGLLGRFLGPIKLCLLAAIIVLGLYFPAPAIVGGMSSLQAFSTGVFEGYGTMDLLGGIFFAGLVCSALRRGRKEDDLSVQATTERRLEDPTVLAKMSVKAGLIGALLLGLIYGGFCLVSASYAASLHGVDRSQLLSTLARLILGDMGGGLANITVAISCLTTAVALTVVFTDYLRKEIFRDKVSYVQALCGTIIVACVMTNFGFSGIMALIYPAVSIIYPALIVLAFVNVAHKLFGYKQVKVPVFMTLLAFLCMQWR